MDAVDAGETAQETPAVEGRAASGSGQGGGGGGGNSGVGYATGSWKGGAIFGDKYVVTRNTRQWMAEIKNNHIYTKNIWGNSGTTRPVGIRTPWCYFNFNEYSSHFSPRDWQRLLNEYGRFRPKHMKVQLYNIQIKQKLITAGDTIYNNDLTAGIHVFCDGSHQYPYTQHPWDEDTMPEMPTTIWDLPQYAYLLAYDPYVNSDGNQFEIDFARALPLYILENSDHAMLRTGENIEFNFKFSCGWVNNNYTNMTVGQMFNPEVGYKRAVESSNDTTKIYNVASFCKYSNWNGGPGMRDLKTGNVDDAENRAGAAGLLQTSFLNGADIGAGGVPARAWGTQPNAYGQGSVHNRDHYQFVTGTEEATTQNTITELNYNMASNNVTYVKNANYVDTELNPIWMFPNQKWDSVSLSRYNPIWVKEPRVDRSTLVDTNDGTIPMAHPPGTIYVKIARIPVPETGTETSGSYLVLYATGQVSCEIAWEVERTHNKNWRPENYLTADEMQTGVYHIDENGVYKRPTTYYDAMPTRRTNLKVL
uniref:VP2 n=1 Tax=Dromedary camel bocaparvovirus 2 TaxID=2014604 RepID=A0A1Z3FW04_9VIRU|nr:VP2 [Dromedary camel bocaparvovirus 2]